MGRVGVGVRVIGLTGFTVAFWAVLIFSFS